jgi:hypothetical protein
MITLLRNKPDLFTNDRNAALSIYSLITSVYSKPLPLLGKMKERAIFGQLFVAQGYESS